MTTLLVGGRIHSPTVPDATAMAVTDGVVAWLGSDEVGRAQYATARVVDLDGAFVAPAFVDAHVHLTATGLTAIGLDLRGATSRDDLLRTLADHVRTHPDGPIWANGWDESGWPVPTPPTTAEIDAAVGRRAAYLARIDVHSAVASTALRALATDLPSLPGYDAQRPLTADAHHRVRALARGLLTAEEQSAARTAALDVAARSGIVAVHECAGPEIGGIDDWIGVRSMDHGVDVIGYWGEAVSSAAAARELVARTGTRGLAGDLFVDGAIGSRTAWLHEPYADHPAGRGTAYLDADAVHEHLAACTQAGVTAGFHVIGDAAASAVVDALDRVVTRFGTAAVARCGHRIEHLEMVSADQAARLAAAGVIASVQPNFDALWGGEHGMYAARLGVHRARGLNPLALLASQGVPLALGSDTPVTSINPWESVRAAVNHHTPGSALSARAAFTAATRGAWRAGGVRDGSTGVLVPGAPASYAVWDVPGGVDAMTVTAPTDGVRRWSTDDRARVPALPRLGPDDALPTCRRTVHRGATIHA